MSGGSRGAWVHGPSSDKSECNSCSSAPAPRQPTVCCVLMLCTVQRALQSNMLLDGLICKSIYKCVLQNHFLFCPIAAWHRIYRPGFLQIPTFFSYSPRHTYEAFSFHFIWEDWIDEKEMSKIGYLQTKFLKYTLIITYSNTYVGF